MASDSPGHRSGDAPRRADARALLGNSSVALLLGTGLAVVVHEVGHWVAGALLGSSSQLFGLWVEHSPPLTGRDAALAALAGPVLSLLIGTAMQILQPFRFRGDFAHLLWIWIASGSLGAGSVQLAIAPLAGDVAVAIDGFGLPPWSAWVAAVLGVLGLIGVAQQWAIHSVRLCGQDSGRLRCFTWYPWLIGAVLNPLLALGLIAAARPALDTAETMAVVLAATAYSLFAPVSLAFAGRVTELEEPLLVKPFPVVGLLALVALVVIEFALGTGPRVG